MIIDGPGRFLQSIDILSMFWYDLSRLKFTHTLLYTYFPIFLLFIRKKGKQCNRVETEILKFFKFLIWIRWFKRLSLWRRLLHPELLAKLFVSGLDRVKKESDSDVLHSIIRSFFIGSTEGKSAVTQRVNHVRG